MLSCHSTPGTRAALQPLAGVVGLSPGSSGGGEKAKSSLRGCRRARPPRSWMYGRSSPLLAQHPGGEEVVLLEAPLLLVLVGRLHREGREADADAEAPLPVIAEEVEVAGDRALQQVAEIAAGAAPAEPRGQPPTGPALDGAERRGRGLKPGQRCGHPAGGGRVRVGRFGGRGFSGRRVGTDVSAVAVSKAASVVGFSAAVRIAGVPSRGRMNNTNEAAEIRSLMVKAPIRFRCTGFYAQGPISPSKFREQ